MKLYNEKLTQAHIDALIPRVQPHDRDFAKMIGSYPTFVEAADTLGPSVAFVNETGTIGMGGLVDFIGTGRAIIWCCYASNIARDFVALFKQGMGILTELHPRRRLEISIDPAHPQAKRLAKLAGFEYEGLMRSYDQFGRDYELWAKINRGVA